MLAIETRGISNPQRERSCVIGLPKTVAATADNHTSVVCRRKGIGSQAEQEQKTPSQAACAAPGAQTPTRRGRATDTPHKRRGLERKDLEQKRQTQESSMPRTRELPGLKPLGTSKSEGTFNGRLARQPGVWG